MATEAQLREAQLREGGALLRNGGLVAFPTETVYGLGADASNDRAVARIFEAKGRPTFNPLIIHIADPEQAESLVRLDSRARALMARFWPGPLTLVLPRAPGCSVSLLASAGLDTLAVRLPAHPLAVALIQVAERPLAAPSANRSGAVSPTLAAHVRESLGDRVDMILDGGACRVGLESTVLDLSGPQAALLRPGGVTAEALEQILGETLIGASFDAGPVRSPGMLLSHYAPSVPVRLNATGAQPGEVLLGFGTQGGDENLSPSGDLQEAAAMLFAQLRALDRPGITGIAVCPIPEQGLGVAINDRLRRAAAPR